jgi:hypothetical protein
MVYFTVSQTQALIALGIVLVLGFGLGLITTVVLTAAAPSEEK